MLIQGWEEIRLGWCKDENGGCSMDWRPERNGIHQMQFA